MVFARNKDWFVVKVILCIHGEGVFIIHGVFEMASCLCILKGLIEICSIPISMEISRCGMLISMDISRCGMPISMEISSLPISTVSEDRKTFTIAMGDQDHLKQ
jgi:hypothetical protein